MKELLNIVSFNLRCVWTGDGINSFVHRAGMIANTIRKENPDVICFQEGTPEIIEFLRKELTEYIILFNGRDENMQGEGLAVAYKQDVVELVGLDCFWLSQTPYIPGSRYDDQSCFPRICQTALMKLKESGKTFWIYNNHLDHISEITRELEIEQVLKKVELDREKLSKPLFLLGDFNAEPDSHTICLCNESSLGIRDITDKCGGTFHDFGKIKEPKKIDYIFVDNKTYSSKFEAKRWEDELDGIYLSDHFPINIKIQL